MDLNVFLVFVMTTIVVVFSPGPTAVLIASQGASNGLQRTLAGVLGVTFATAIYFAMSATGIASLIVASHTLFLVIKWAGVAFLVYLGLTAVLSKSGGLVVTQSGARKSSSALFVRGFLIEFSNPKALLYFSAVLPQFIDMNRPLAAQFLQMSGATFVVQVLIYGGYAFLGHRLVQGGAKAWVISLINKTAGAALIFAGIRMASVSNR